MGSQLPRQQLAILGRRPHAARAELDLLRLVVFHDRNRLKIRVKPPACVASREAHRVAERGTFATFSTFCHIEGPPGIFSAISLGL